MTKQYLAIPWEITCNCKDSETIKSYWDKWNGRVSKLSGMVKAVIADTEKDARKKMFELVKTFIESFPDVKDGKIKVSDFELKYNINAIENGEVWVMSNMVSYANVGHD